MLVLLSLASIDVRLGATHRWRSAMTGHSSECLRSFKLPTEPRQRHPESASGGSAFWRKSWFKPREPARGLHAMLIAIAGIVESVRATVYMTQSCSAAHQVKIFTRDN